MPNVVFVPANKSWTRRLLWWCIPDSFWFTYRLPFQKAVRISYPTGTLYPEQHEDVIEHELVHARFLARWYGPVVALLAQVLPLPVFFSGRWFIEREAYLQDIRTLRFNVEEVIEILVNDYWEPWPPQLMRKWFEQQLLERGFEERR